MTAEVDLQNAFEGDDAIAAAIPSLTQVEKWVSIVLDTLNLADLEVTVRFVDESESQALNGQYRGKNSPTNVLSFPFEAPPGIELPLLGDLVVCAPVISSEAVAQAKPVTDHYAHMIIHGTLHLLGYDHINDDDAQIMESLEIRLLAQLDIDDPYQEL